MSVLAVVQKLAADYRDTGKIDQDDLDEAIGQAK